MREEKTAKTAPADNTLQRMVDREAKRAEGKGEMCIRDRVEDVESVEMYHYDGVPASAEKKVVVAESDIKTL